MPKDGRDWEAALRQAHAGALRPGPLAEQRYQHEFVAVLDEVVPDVVPAPPPPELKEGVPIPFKEGYLMLKKGRRGRLHVVGLDGDGEMLPGGYIVTLLPDGTFMREQDCDVDFLDLNGAGQIKFN